MGALPLHLVLANTGSVRRGLLLDETHFSVIIEQGASLNSEQTRARRDAVEGNRPRAGGDHAVQPRGRLRDH
ncbi:uncharacterized protein B0H18DRAFT_1021592 [Fomitopsis serialis]|uniref:uncharacterized protein n=1 Tax=Fomitopsis serialis TaxID=139415 RepID=UPI0020087C9C|nr:uncharacterized protein B0H18DRAFT_1021592 [Neoantrodia serialis]KAH9921326.1 hypothetical protein B0H18DRAFT_1021592 [Neoantrodia serialis]